MIIHWITYTWYINTDYYANNHGFTYLLFNRCVVKYLYDLYSQFSFNMLGFLVEVLEKGPSNIQSPVLTIIHCLLHYVDMTSATQTINSDLLRTVAKFVEVQ